MLQVFVAQAHPTDPSIIVFLQSPCPLVLVSEARNPRVPAANTPRPATKEVMMMEGKHLRRTTTTTGVAVNGTNRSRHSRSSNTPRPATKEVMMMEVKNLRMTTSTTGAAVIGTNRSRHSMSGRIVLSNMPKMSTPIGNVKHSWKIHGHTRLCPIKEQIHGRTTRQRKASRNHVS